MLGNAGVMSLVGDLYSFQDLLSADESATVTRVREFLASEINSLIAGRAVTGLSTFVRANRRSARPTGPA
ncbi:hypothetical protein Acsp02_57780 [Actinoplanes sp. NBRC 103695]|nr:hypothetical protein Acsp02_57780 [Actinoplanes sp. NBRC 103695]